MSFGSYRYKTRRPEAFLKQLRHYVEGNHSFNGGHFFYLHTKLKPGKDPDKTARKIMTDYRVETVPWKRARRHRKLLPSIHLLTSEQDILVISTYGTEPPDGNDGKQSFFRANRTILRDIRIQPLVFRGYSIKYPEVLPGKRRFTVRLHDKHLAMIRAGLVGFSTKPRFHDPVLLEEQIRKLGLEGYEPVQKQLGSVVRAVNTKRRRAGLVQLSEDCISRSVYKGKVFADVTEAA